MTEEKTKEVIQNNLSLIINVLDEVNYNLFYFDYGDELVNKYSLQDIKKTMEKLRDLVEEKYLD